MFSSQTNTSDQSRKIRYLKPHRKVSVQGPVSTPFLRQPNHESIQYHTYNVLQTSRKNKYNKQIWFPTKQTPKIFQNNVYYQNSRILDISRVTSIAQKQVKQQNNKNNQLKAFDTILQKITNLTKRIQKNQQQIKLISQKNIQKLQYLTKYQILSLIDNYQSNQSLINQQNSRKFDNISNLILKYRAQTQLQYYHHKFNSYNIDIFKNIQQSNEDKKCLNTDIEVILESMKIQFNQIRKDIDQKINTIKNQRCIFNGQSINIPSKHNSLSSTLSTISQGSQQKNKDQKILSNSMISFVYQQKVYCYNNQSLTNETIINQKLYHIDAQGYLLDNSQHYLTNQQGKQIKLSQNQIAILQKINILN